MNIWKFILTISTIWFTFLFMGYAGSVIYTGNFDMTGWDSSIRGNILTISIIGTFFVYNYWRE